MADETPSAKRVDFSGGESQDKKEPNTSKKAPPRKSTTQKKASTSSRPAGRPRGLEGQLHTQFVMLATFISVYDRTDGMILAQNAEGLAKAWAELANRNAGVKKALDRMMESAGYGQLIFAHMAIIIPIMQNHGVLPSLPGFEPPAQNGAPPPADTQQQPQRVPRVRRPTPHPPATPAMPDIEPPFPTG